MQHFPQLLPKKEHPAYAAIISHCCIWIPQRAVPGKQTGKSGSGSKTYKEQLFVVSI